MLAILAVLLLAACGADSADPPPPDTPVSHTPDDDQPTTDLGGEPAAECPEGSEPHVGEPPPGCDFVHAGCCYSTAAEACAQAGCAEDACSILESYPAQVRCN